MDPLLVSLAESVGSKLGTLAAKVEVAQKMITGASSKLKRETKKLANNVKTLAGTPGLKKTSRLRPARLASGKRAASRRARARGAH
jgi:hypothetical protein